MAKYHEFQNFSFHFFCHTVYGPTIWFIPFVWQVIYIKKILMGYLSIPCNKHFNWPLQQLIHIGGILCASQESLVMAFPASPYFWRIVCCFLITEYILSLPFTGLGILVLHSLWLSFWKVKGHPVHHAWGRHNSSKMAFWSLMAKSGAHKCQFLFCEVLV